MQTMKQYLSKFYGFGVNDVAKADDPVLTTTGGTYNPVYGAMAFSQLNNEANAFGLMPKNPWDKSGWRVITTDAGATADGGVAEAGLIPDSQKPTFQEISTKPKQVIHVFSNSYIQEGLAGTKDDISGDFSMMRSYTATLHAKRINEQLLVDGNTLAGNNFESIDRVTASTAYATSAGWDAGDEDIYGIDRSANSWADAVVNFAATDRDLDDSLIRDTLATIRTNGGRTNIMLTGEDTYARILGIYENRVRYAGVLSTNEKAQITINGVETDSGIDAGIRVAMVYGIPLFTSQAVAKDTISRIYLLDTTVNEGSQTPRLFMAMLYPTLYYETGANTSIPNPFVTGDTTNKGMYYTSGELICTFFKAQGSIRNLK